MKNGLKPKKVKKPQTKLNKNKISAKMHLIVILAEICYLGNNQHTFYCAKPLDIVPKI